MNCRGLFGVMRVMIDAAHLSTAFQDCREVFLIAYRLLARIIAQSRYLIDSRAS